MQPGNRCQEYCRIGGDTNVHFHAKSLPLFVMLCRKPSKCWHELKGTQHPETAKDSKHTEHPCELHRHQPWHICQERYPRQTTQHIGHYPSRAQISTPHDRDLEKNVRDEKSIENS